jgi:hypothetical protein
MLRPNRQIAEQDCDPAGAMAKKDENDGQMTNLRAFRPFHLL